MWCKISSFTFHTKMSKHHVILFLGFQILMDVFGCVTGPIDECVNILKVSPNFYFQGDVCVHNEQNNEHQ